jgi:RNA-directed DNA polymerase
MLYEESDVPIVPLLGVRQHNLIRGKGHYFNHSLKEGGIEEIANMLKTPEKIREFQRKIYLKAKREPKFRFYQLYDKVWRRDILEHAWNRVCAKKGKPGIDNVSIEQIRRNETQFLDELQKELKEKRYKPQAVLRVHIPKPNGKKRPLGIPTVKDRIVQMAVKIVIEPVFEADFEENSYGFRPKRNTRGALTDIRNHLYRGFRQVMDADLTSYFDNIPHDKLMDMVANRIIDKMILKLIKMWLKVPIYEDGKYTGGKKNKKGTPQGGVISPLLSNIYLNKMDKEVNKHTKKTNMRLVRYADDFVILAKFGVKQTCVKVIEILTQLGLELNEAKTRVLDLRKGDKLDFLGFTFRQVNSWKNGKPFILTVPSKQAMKRIRLTVKQMLTEQNNDPLETVIGKLNRILEGWMNYFRYENSSKAFDSLSYYVKRKVIRFIRKRQGRIGFAWRKYRTEVIHDEIGLIQIGGKVSYKLV